MIFILLTLPYWSRNCGIWKYTSVFILSVSRDILAYRFTFIYLVDTFIQNNEEQLKNTDGLKLNRHTIPVPTNFGSSNNEVSSEENSTLNSILYLQGLISRLASVSGGVYEYQTSQSLWWQMTLSELDGLWDLKALFGKQFGLLTLLSLTKLQGG